MMRKNFNVLSSCTLAATVALFAVLANGCDRREEVYPVEGNAYTLDPAFKADIDRQVAERDALAKEQRKLIKEMQALVAKYNGDAKAAAASREGVELGARLKAGEESFKSNRLETARITRERIARAVSDSERIKRGEAKAIDLSKKQKDK